MIRFSKREDYGVVLMADLLKNFEKRLIPLSEIAQKHKIPLLFLRNIAADLRKTGLISAVEGKNGGYKLAKNPSNIQLGKIIQALSKKSIFSCCQETSDGRCKVVSCPHGFSLRRLNNEFLETVSRKSLKEIFKNADHFRFRRKP